MRAFIIILSLLSLGFSTCIHLNSSDIANTSRTLNQADCLILDDVNATISVTDYHVSNTVNMTAFSVVTNPTTGEIYQCDFDRMNLNVSIPFGNSYVDANHNVTVNCPAFPKINGEFNITSGESYSNPSYNLTVNALFRRYNITQTLNFSGQVNFTDENISISAPPYPRLNHSETLDYGSNYTDADTNVTIIAPPYPQLNENSTLRCGQSDISLRLNMSISAPPCANISRTLDYGETLSLPELGVSVKAPDKLNVNAVLEDGQNYSNSSAAINLTCRATTQQFNSYCANISASNLTRVWQEMDLRNFTCNTYAYRCIDNLTEQCTPQEKFSDQNGLIECVNRVVNESEAACNDTVDKLHICQNDQAQASLNKQNDATSSDNLVNLGVVFFGGSLLVVAVLVGGYYFVNRKFHEKGENR